MMQRMQALWAQMSTQASRMRKLAVGERYLPHSILTGLSQVVHILQPGGRRGMAAKTPERERGRARAPVTRVPGSHRRTQAQDPCPCQQRCLTRRRRGPRKDKARGTKRAGARTDELPREVTRQADVEQDAQRQVDDDARYLCARAPGWTQPRVAAS